MRREHYARQATRLKALADTSRAPEQRRHYLNLFDSAVEDLRDIDSPNRDVWGAGVALIITVAALLLLTACAAPNQWVNANPEWNPPGGKEQADAQCRAQAASAGGYDWVAATLNRRDAYTACMEGKGFRLQPATVVIR